MAINEILISIPGRLHSVATEGHVTGADEIYDDVKEVTQDVLNGAILEEKTYTPADYSGMGRVVLKKNMVNGVNTLTQDMFYKGEVGSRVPNTNTIYIIQYDFTLGEDITVPANCVLEFDGGSLSAGSGENMDTITGNNTAIKSELVKIFDADVKFTGNWNVVESYAEWFGNIPQSNIAVDSAPYIQAALNMANSTNIRKVKLLAKTYYISDTLYIYPCCKLSGSVTPYWHSTTQIIATDNTKDAIVGVAGTDGIVDIDINHISLRSTVGENNCGIRFEAAQDIQISNNTFRNLYILYFKYGIVFDSTVDTLFNIIDECIFNHNYIGLKVNGHNSSLFNVNRIISSNFVHGYIGIWIDSAFGCSGNVIESCSFEQNGQGYNLEDFKVYGAFAIKFTSESNSTAMGTTYITSTYFEANRPRRSPSSGTIESGEIESNGEIIPSDYWLPFNIEGSQKILNSSIYIQGGYNVKVDNVDIYEDGRFITVYDNSIVDMDNLVINANPSTNNTYQYTVSIIKNYPNSSSSLKLPTEINIGSGVIMARGTEEILDRIVLIDTPLCQTSEEYTRYAENIKIHNSSLLDGGPNVYIGKGKADKIFFGSNGKVNSPFIVTKSGCTNNTRNLNSLSKINFNKEIKAEIVGEQNTLVTGYMKSDTFAASDIHRPIRFYSSNINNVIDNTQNEFTIWEDVTFENITFNMEMESWRPSMFKLQRKGVNIKFINCIFISQDGCRIFDTSSNVANIIFDNCTFNVQGTQTLYIFHAQAPSDISVICYNCTNEVVGQDISQDIPIKWY